MQQLVGHNSSLEQSMHALLILHVDEIILGMWTQVIFNNKCIQNDIKGQVHIFLYVHRSSKIHVLNVNTYELGVRSAKHTVTTILVGVKLAVLVLSASG